MPDATDPRPDTERIDRILRVVEHVWKTYPQWTFGEVIEHVLSVGHADDDHECLAKLSDAIVEERYRRFLQRVFTGAKDVT